MGGKILVSILVGVIITVFVAAIPQPDYILYGNAYVNGVKLLHTDTARISLEVDGEELTSFNMGDVNEDVYVLRVPMNDEDLPGYAQPGDIAYIY